MLLSQLIQCILEKFSRGYYLMKTDSVVLYIGIEHLVGFRALSYKIKLIPILIGAERNVFVNAHDEISSGGFQI